MHRMVLFILLLSTIAIGAVRAEGEETQKETPWYEAALKDLTSDDEATRVKAYEEIGLWRDRLVAQLIRIVAEEPDDNTPVAKGGRPYLSDSGKYAVELLGELRAPEAVPVLIDRVNVRAAVGAYSELSISRSSPVMFALIKIGKPAVAAILERLDGETDEKKLKAYKRITRREEVVYSVRGEPVLPLERESYPKYEYEDIVSRFRDDKLLPEIERLRTAAAAGSDRIDVRNPRWRELKGERQKKLETARTVRKKAYDELEKQIKKVVWGLFRCLYEYRNEYYPNDRKTLAIKLLGRFRVSRPPVVFALVNNILFEDPGAPEDDSTRAYPTVECLVQIGRQTFWSILRRLSRANPCDEAIGLYAAALRRIEGEPRLLKLLDLIYENTQPHCLSKTGKDNVGRILRILRETSVLPGDSEEID